MPRLLLRCLLLCCLALLAGCPKTHASKGSALDEVQYDYSAAIRWGDFEGAWNLVDPKVRAEKPLTDIDFSRYKQIKISGYTDLGGTVEPSGVVVRDVEIGVINRQHPGRAHRALPRTLALGCRGQALVAERRPAGPVGASSRRQRPGGGGLCDNRRPPAGPVP
jgi:hypothetical protein